MGQLLNPAPCFHIASFAEGFKTTPRIHLPTSSLFTPKSKSYRREEKSSNRWPKEGPRVISTCVHILLLLSHLRQNLFGIHKKACMQIPEHTRIMARAWRWFSAVRRALARSSCTSAADLDAIKNSTTIYNPITMEELPAEVSTIRPEQQESALVQKDALTREDLAAITIQAYFRGHLARRAFRALKSLVRLQAVVRGVCVRRQARVAMHCMQALVRLQVRVRARQLLGKSVDVEVGA